MRSGDIKHCLSSADNYLFKPDPEHLLRLKWTKACDEMQNLCYGRSNPATPEAPAPTVRQFKTIVKSLSDFKNKCIKIVGRTAFMQNSRQLTRKSSDGLVGPGQLGQVDDMVPKVRLVDEFKYLPLGTPRVFMMVDTWSKIIVGAHDTLEESTFAETTECLLNAFLDKRPFAKAHGLKLNHKYHPCVGVFDAIVGDNGPLGGSLPDVIPERVCDVANTAAYRPDLKSDVETSFHSFLKQVAEDQSAYTRAKRCRGDDDPNVLAYLTPTEFRKILWAWIESYNRRPLRDWLPAELMKAEDTPDPSPYLLWNWGLENLKGCLRDMSERELRLALLPRGTGTLTSRRGISFRGFTYIWNNADKLDASGLFDSRKVSVRYESKYIRQISIEHKGKLIPASLTPDFDKDYGHMTFNEGEKKKHAKDRALRRAKRGADQARRHLRAVVHECNVNSEAEAKKAFPSAKVRKYVIQAISVTTNRRRAVERERGRHRSKVERVFKQRPKSGNGDEQAAREALPAPKLTGVELLKQKN